MSEGRVAVRFRRGAAVKDLDHSGALRLWQEVLQKAGLPQPAGVRGASRQRPPRFALAAPLPVGYSSDAEWIELHLPVGEATRPFGEHPRTDATEATAGGRREPAAALSLSAILEALNDCLPDGFRALEACLVAPGAPSLQAQLRWAEYRMLMPGGLTARDLEHAMDSFFSRDALPWEETIEGRTRRFDLRALVDDAWVEQSEAGLALGLRLDASSTGTGRPDSVLAGLGMGSVLAKHRTRLLFSHLPEASRLWRARGRFESDRPER